MAKPVIKFTAAPYEVNGYKGFRPQLEPKDGVFDRDFCQEVVTEKRLSMSADELLHGSKMLAEVAGKKINEDGRPRGITKLIKWAPYGSGNLESPSSPWNETCKAIIRPVLLGESAKRLDATFQNTTEGIGVRLNDVTYDGAKTVQNVVKQDGTFSANGSHMEFLEGDSASLIIGETVIPLECKESDVSHARFDAPAALYDIEPGSVMQFVMKSRGGVENGQVYTTKKNVTLLAGEPKGEPKIVSMISEKSGKDGVSYGWEDTFVITLENCTTEGAKVRRVLIDDDGEIDAETAWDSEYTSVEIVSPTVIKFKVVANDTREPSENWRTMYHAYTEVMLADGKVLSAPMTFDEGED